MMPRFEIYRDRAGKWRWRLKSSNGEIVAVGQGYASKQKAREGIDCVARISPKAEVKHGRRKDRAK